MSEGTTRKAVGIASAVVGLVVLVAVNTWAVSHVVGQEAADAGALAGQAAAEAVVEPLQKSLEQLVAQGIDSQVRDEKTSCMEYYHQEIQPRPRNRLCNAEADAYRVYLVCKLTKDDCKDPRRQE